MTEAGDPVFRAWRAMILAGYARANPHRHLEETPIPDWALLNLFHQIDTGATVSRDPA